MTDLNGRGHSPSHGRVWLVLALAVAGGIWLWGSHPWRHEAASHHVVYDVTGSGGRSGLIDFVVAGGQRQVDGAALPWSYEMDVTASGRGASLYVSAQNGPSGVVSCSIQVDGETVAANTSSGAYVVVSCSAPLP